MKELELKKTNEGVLRLLIHTPSTEIYNACLQQLQNLDYHWVGHRDVLSANKIPSYGDETVLVLNPGKILTYGDRDWETWQLSPQCRMTYQEFFDLTTVDLYEELLESINSLEKKIKDEGD